jgi:hypothetical protein
MGLFDGLNRACQRAFGEPVTYRRSGHPDHPMSGIFDESYEIVTLIEGAENSTVSPALTITDADLPEGAEVAQRDRFVIGGRSYRVRDVQPQGGGETLLLLNEVSS